MKKKIGLALFFSVFLLTPKISHTQMQMDDSSCSSRQDSLAFELCQLYGLDQGIRDRSISDFFLCSTELVDSLNFFKIMDFITKHGFPRKDLLGEENLKHECVNSSAFAILLHNPHRLVNDSTNLQILINEVHKGNLKVEALATILDKYYWAKKGNNQRVLYGSSFGSPCIETKEETNRARKRIGLPPLADSLFKKCP